MIMKPTNWDNVQVLTNRPKLPLGAYICKIKLAKVQSNSFGDQLAILFDIAAGEHTGFYQKDFDSNQNDDKKWRGVLRLWLPKDDGSEKDEMTKSVLKGFVTAAEKSNPGYRWDWNEASLPGKQIGILFRNEEWEYQGKQGWAVRPFRALSTDSVRNGDYTLPNDKPLANKDNQYMGDANDSAYIPNTDFKVVNVDTDELPF